jgi:hypothetical protein
VKRGCSKMVVGDDVKLEAIPNLMGKMVIGKFCGKVVRLEFLRIWIDSIRSTMLGYRHMFHTMSRGWICFKFHSKVEMDVIFSQA